MLALAAAASLAAPPSLQAVESARPMLRARKAVRVAPHTPAQRAAIGAGPFSLVVKFRDDLAVRADSAGALFSRSGRDVTTLEEWRVERDDLRLHPLITADEGRLRAFEERAEARSGRAQPDLAGLFRVETAGLSLEGAAALAASLRARPEVEFASISPELTPPPEDYPPTTPDLSPRQSYMGPDPGLDFDALHEAGAFGAGLRYSDCEYGWVLDHEDLVDIGVTAEPGQTPSPFVQLWGWDQHGTAVVGADCSPHDGYGTNGLAPDARAFVYPEHTIEEGFRRVTCIANAAMDSGTGDVVLLEMQTGYAGPLSPAEVDPAVWLVTRAAVDAGVVVVAAAGNGSADLDGPAFANYRSFGDSGAIIVGAGTPDTNHDKADFSTFGTRVDVQAWGLMVFTPGYGEFMVYGSDRRQAYTNAFSGTSSASMLIAGACLGLQSYAEGIGLPRLGPEPLRELLAATGIPQGSGGHIGPFPDLAAAMAALDDGGVRYCDPSANVAFEEGARVGLIGTTELALDDVTLTVERSTPSSPGYFFLGGATDERPVVGAGGTICIAPGALGLYRLMPPTLSGPGGGSTRAVALTSTPGSLFAPGDVVYFQYWYRDVGGPHGTTSAFSDALAVRFR
ncbi:MAG: S8 family serine peptidase [Planctomycetota bacterium]